ncbi:Uncharacterised protein [Candidatus Burarchaeum australiense]|nr:Uncharacterised protein [Candidatus Burarchaeum australiense]
MTEPLGQKPMQKSAPLSDHLISRKSAFFFLHGHLAMPEKASITHEVNVMSVSKWLNEAHRSLQTLFRTPEELLELTVSPVLEREHDRLLAAYGEQQALFNEVFRQLSRKDRLTSLLCLSSHDMAFESLPAIVQIAVHGAEVLPNGETDFSLGNTAMDAFEYAFSLKWNSLAEKKQIDELKGVLCWPGRSRPADSDRVMAFLELFSLAQEVAFNPQTPSAIRFRAASLMDAVLDLRIVEPETHKLLFNYSESPPDWSDEAPCFKAPATRVPTP